MSKRRRRKEPPKPSYGQLWDYHQRVAAATAEPPYDADLCRALLKEGVHLGVVQLTHQDPKETWMLLHRLEPGLLSKAVSDNILSVDTRLWPLEYEFYVQAAINHEAWQEYRQQYAVALELYGEEAAKELPEPETPLACRWIAELPKLNYGRIAEMSQAHYNADRGEFECSDWREAVCWKADVDVPAASLLPLQRRVYQLLWAGFEFEEIAFKLRLHVGDVIEEVRVINAKLRQWDARDYRHGSRESRSAPKGSGRLQQIPA
jgi:hypothetical protein